MIHLYYLIHSKIFSKKIRKQEKNELATASFWVKNLSINKAFPNSKGLPPTILVPLEEWDDTTDVILYVYQQKYSSLFKNTPTITLDNIPERASRYGNYEALENQRAEVTGSSHDYSRIVFTFDANIEDLEDSYGYTITVKKQNPVNHYKLEKIAQYTIKGESREEFEIIKEQLLK
jgi:hypothetical protein